MLLEKYSKDKSVLKYVLLHEWIFGIYALRGGAKSVHSVDSLAKAIELTDKNVAVGVFGAKTTFLLPKMH